MSIESDTLVRNPVLYWPLDDATGPAAVDASGNGHHGVYGGSFMTHSWGVLAGELAAQFGIGGSVSLTSFPQPAAAPFTVLWWSSLNVVGVSGTNPFMRHVASSGSRGWAVNVNASGQATLQCYRADGALQVSSPLSLGGSWQQWHPWAVRYDGSATITLWLNGSLGQSVPLSGGMATITAADSFQIYGGLPQIGAHVAYFDRSLSTTDIAAIAAYRQEWPYGPSVNAVWPQPPAGSGGGMLSPSDPIVIQQNQDLTDIRTAVRHTYTNPE